MSLKIVNIYYSNSVFRDIAESLENVFTSRDISVNITHNLNKDDPNTWILFGINELPPSTLLPEKYIVYQLEQISVKGNKWLTEKYIQLMKGAKQVWDYSLKNVNLLGSHGVKNVLHVPISYTKNMRVIDNTSIPSDDKDIDILFMGSISLRRKELLHKLQDAGYNVNIADGGLWGEDRINLLKRAKAVINIHYYGEDSPLEMARLSVLLANKCFIISEIGGEPGLDKKLGKGVVFGKYDELFKLCKKYLVPDMVLKRNEIAREGFRVFSEKPYLIPNNFYKMVKDSVSVDSLGDKGEEIKPISASDKIDAISLRMDSDGYPSIQVPELKEYPLVSITTITKNRKLFTSMMLHQVEKMDYPKDKLEWIIVDDSDILEDYEFIKSNVNTLLGKKIKITCIHLTSADKNSISSKRNLAAEKASGEYICHVDDDDYYFHHSLKTKVAFLEHYKKTKGCIGSTKLPVYNLTDDTSVIYETNGLPEASMVYSKSFWAEKGFSEHIEGEGYPFTSGRREQCLDIPYLFSMIAVNHGKNVTGKTRLYTGNTNNHKASKKVEDSDRETITNLLEAMDDETADILLSIKGYMNRPRVTVEDTL
jgi:hypothetical protein